MITQAVPIFPNKFMTIPTSMKASIPKTTIVIQPIGEKISRIYMRYHAGHKRKTNDEKHETEEEEEEEEDFHKRS
jgi:hypothetical protein